MRIKMYRVKWLGIWINLTVVVPFIVGSAGMLMFFYWMGW